MPVVRITTLKGKSKQQKDAISAAIHEALVESYNDPAEDLFHIFEELEAENFRFTRTFHGIRTDDFLLISIHSGIESRPTKYKFFGSCAATIARKAGMRAEDVFIKILSSPLEDWSFSSGVPLEKMHNDNH